MVIFEIQEIADTYGLDAQLDMVVEECAELIQAVQKRKRGRESNITEEIADVLNVIDSVIYLTKIQKEIDKIRSDKVIRQINRIHERSE